MYDPKLKPKGLIDGLTKFFTPTNRRKSRSSSQSGMGFYPVRRYNLKFKPKTAPKLKSEAPVLKCKPDDQESVETPSSTSSPTLTKDVPPQLLLNTKEEKTPSLSTEDKSNSNSSSPHSQLMRTGSSQLKGLFDGLSHLYAAPTEPRKRGMYGLPPVYVPPKRARKSSAPSTTPGHQEGQEASSEGSSTPPEGKITPTKLRSLMKSRSGLSASASKLVKKARAIGSKKKGPSMAEKFASAAKKNGKALIKSEGKSNIKKEVMAAAVATPKTEDSKEGVMKMEEGTTATTSSVASTSSQPPGKTACVSIDQWLRLTSCLCVHTLTISSSYQSAFVCHPLSSLCMNTCVLCTTYHSMVADQLINISINNHRNCRSYPKFATLPPSQVVHNSMLTCMLAAANKLG